MAGGRRRQWRRRSSGLRAARRHGRGRGWRGDTDGSDGQRTGAPERRNGLPEEKDDGVMGWQHPARRGGATFWTSVSTALRLASGGTEARPWKRRSLRGRGRWWRGPALLQSTGRDGRSCATAGREGEGCGRRAWRVEEVEGPFQRAEGNGWRARRSAMENEKRPEFNGD